MLVCVCELQRLRERQIALAGETVGIYTQIYERVITAASRRDGWFDGGGLLLSVCSPPSTSTFIKRSFICFCWSYFNDLTFLSNSRVYSSANDCTSVSGTHSGTPVNKHFVCKCLSLVPAVRLFYFLLFCHFPFWFCNFHGPKLIFCYVCQKNSLNLEFNLNIYSP